MKVFALHSKDINKELVLMKKELNRRLETIDESDGNFERVDTLGKSESVSRKDFEYCLALDKFSFVMEAERENSQIIIKKEYGEKA